MEGIASLASAAAALHSAANSAPLPGSSNFEKMLGAALSGLSAGRTTPSLAPGLGLPPADAGKSAANKVPKGLEGLPSLEGQPGLLTALLALQGGAGPSPPEGSSTTDTSRVAAAAAALAASSSADKPSMLNMLASLLGTSSFPSSVPMDVGTAGAAGTAAPAVPHGDYLRHIAYIAGLSAGSNNAGGQLGGLPADANPLAGLLAGLAGGETTAMARGSEPGNSTDDDDRGGGSNKRSLEVDLDSVTDLEERKRLKRMAKNRATAAASRKRKKLLLQSLSERVDALESQNGQLRQALYAKHLECEMLKMLSQREAAPTKTEAPAQEEQPAQQPAQSS